MYFTCVLPLNQLGVQHLALGTINASQPDVRLLARPGERPAGVYLWCVYARGALVAGMALFMEKMMTPQYAGVPLARTSYDQPPADPAELVRIAARIRAAMR